MTPLLLTKRQSAEALGMSLSHFQRWVQPFITPVCVGQLVNYEPAELQRWVEKTRSTRPNLVSSLVLPESRPGALTRAGSNTGGTE